MIRRQETTERVAYPSRRNFRGEERPGSFPLHDGCACSSGGVAYASSVVKP